MRAPLYASTPPVGAPLVPLACLGLAGCLGGPKPEAWLAVGFRTPAQTFRTFQTGLRADLPDLEYRCLGADMKRRVGADGMALHQLLYREFRSELRVIARRRAEDAHLAAVYAAVRDSLRGDGYRVRYALADPSSFRPGEPTPQDLVARATWRPDPEDPASFDHLLDSDLGAIDVVPEVSGTYEELRPRAVQLEAYGERVWVESIADLLATLTIPRREKDAGRVRRLRELQRQAMVSSTIGRGSGASSPSS